MLSQRELDVMSILFVSEEPLTSSGIVEKMKDLTQSTVIAVVRKLYRDGMVEEVGVTHSGKVMSRLYAPTEEGKTVVKNHFVEYFKLVSNIIPASEICKAILSVDGVKKEEIAELRKEISKIEKK